MFQASEAAFAQLLISGTVVHEAEYEDMRRNLRIEADPNVAVIISVDRYPELAAGQPVEWRIKIGQRLMAAIREAVTVPFLWVWIEEGIVALLLDLRSTPSLNEGCGRLLRLVRSIQKNVEGHGYSVSAGIGSFYEDPYSMQSSYEEAKASMVDRFFQGNHVIYQYEKEKKAAGGMNKPLAAEYKAELYARVRMGDETGAARVLNMILEALANVYRMHVDMFKSEVIELTMGLTRTALDMGGDAAALLSENAAVVQALIGTVRYNNFVKRIGDYCRKITNLVERQQPIEASPMVLTAIKYMKEHHRQKLTLQSIAKSCHVSPYYLSHVFTKETGASCIDYLTQIRLQKAVFLLETTEMTIQQIASQIGFQDPNYFARKFKKYADCSPTAYRTARLC